jgi:hypothetical protein
MSEALFSLLAESDLGNDAMLPRAEARLREDESLVELHDLALNISERLPKFSGRATPFSFISTSALGGASFICDSAGCRLAQVDAGARFAALYADRVVLPNPFDRIAEWSGRGDLDSWTKAAIQHDFLVYSKALYLLKPLILGGIVQFANFHQYGVCVDCLIKSLGEKGGMQVTNIKRIKSYLETRYLDGVRGTLANDDGKLIAELNGPLDLIEHGSCIHVFGERAAKYFAKKADQAPVPITRTELKRFGMFDDLVKSATEDVVRQNYFSTVNGVNYLTNRQIDFDVITKFGKSHNHRSFDATAFAHTLPVLEDIPLRKLLSLRAKEGEAFRSYRAALDRAMKAVPKEKSKDLGSLFSDIVRPEIDRISVTVKKSRKLLLQRISGDLLATVGSVGLGFFSGVLSPEIGTAVGALGGVHFTSKIFKNLAELAFEPSKAADSKYYFLWKLERLKKHQIH